MRNLKETEEPSEDQLGSPIGMPRVVVLLPTNELVLQIQRVAKDLSKTFLLRSRAFYHGMGHADFKRTVSSATDILVSTPGRLLNMLHARNFSLSNCTHIVLDEADTLLDDRVGFSQDVDKVLHSCLRVKATLRKEPPRVVCVAATATVAFDQNLEKLIEALPQEYRNLGKIYSPGLHSPPPTVQQRFVPISRAGNQKQRLVAQMLLRQSPLCKTVIFVGKVCSMELLRRFLERSGFLHFTWQQKAGNLQERGRMYDCIHGFMKVSERVSLLKAFASPTDSFSLLIASDLVSRGMDFAGVEHVILYDFPRNPVDYLHRIGRTGRASRPGMITSLITAHRKKTAAAIQHFLRKGKALSGACEGKPDEKSGRFRFTGKRRQRQAIQKGGF